MRRAGNVLVVVAATLLAGCSSGGGDATPSTVTTTESPPATPESTTTTSTTTAPATTSTTLDPATQLAAEVEADLLEALAAARSAEMDPFNAEAEEEALDGRIGVIRTNLQAKLADFRANNFAIRANDQVPASVNVEVDAQLVRPSTDVVQVQICEVDSWIKVEVGAGPDGSDAVVDPSIISARSTVFLRLIDGRWKFEGGNEIERWEGAVECAAQ